MSQLCVQLCAPSCVSQILRPFGQALALAEAEGVDRQKMMTLLVPVALNLQASASRLIGAEWCLCLAVAQNTTIFDCLIYKGYGQRVAER